MLIRYYQLTLLLRQTTGQREQPNVQQQHKQPQNSHFTLTGRAFFSTEFILWRVSWYSSGATLPVRAQGNSTSKRLLNPNLWKTFLTTPFQIVQKVKKRSPTHTVTFPAPLTITGSLGGVKSNHSSSELWDPSSLTVDIAFKSSFVLAMTVSFLPYFSYLLIRILKESSQTQSNLHSFWPILATNCDGCRLKDTAIRNYHWRFLFVILQQLNRFRQLYLFKNWGKF